MRRLPPLTALRAFEAAARHCSAQAAAQELAVSPTAISHQIRQLEDALGVALFVRKPRQLMLTEKGQALLADLTPAFDAMAQAVARARQPARCSAVTLSATPAVATRWLLPRLPSLQTRHPELDLHLVISHRWTPLDGMQADLAIRYGQPPWPGLTAHHLFDNEFVPVCSPALQLTEPTQLPRHTLLHFEPQLSPLTHKRWRKDWHDWQRIARVPELDTHRGLVFSDETHAMAAAMAAQGVALMSRALVADALAAGTLTAPFGPALQGQPFYLAYPSEREDDPAIAAVRQWLMDAKDSVIPEPVSIPAD